MNHSMTKQLQHASRPRLALCASIILLMPFVASSQTLKQTTSPPETQVRGGPTAHAPYSSFETHYRLERGDSRLGKGVITLSRADTPGCHVMEQTAVPRGFLRWITGDVVERSAFCVTGDTVRTSEYRYYRDGVGADKENFEAKFNWSTMQANIDTGESIALEAGVLDKLNVQAVIRAWLINTVNRTGRLPTDSLKVTYVDKDQLDSYEFAVKERAVIEVPAGRYATVRVDRIDRPSRRSQVWLSPEHGYIVIKAEQQKRDDPPVRLLLTDVPVMPAAAR